MSLLDQSGVTGGGLEPLNMDNMWTERFGNYDCLVTLAMTIIKGKNSVTRFVRPLVFSSENGHKGRWPYKGKVK